MYVLVGVEGFEPPISRSQSARRRPNSTIPRYMVPRGGVGPPWRTYQVRILTTIWPRHIKAHFWLYWLKVNSKRVAVWAFIYFLISYLLYIYYIINFYKNQIVYIILLKYTSHPASFAAKRAFSFSFEKHMKRICQYPFPIRHFKHLMTFRTIKFWHIYNSFLYFNVSFRVKVKTLHSN